MSYIDLQTHDDCQIDVCLQDEAAKWAVICVYVYFRIHWKNQRIYISVSVTGETDKPNEAM